MDWATLLQAFLAGVLLGMVVFITARSRNCRHTAALSADLAKCRNTLRLYSEQHLNSGWCLQDFDNYANQAMSTAIYPGRGEIMGLLYSGLGLAGEAGEVANKIKKCLRDDDCTLTDEKRQAIAKELGAVGWYCAAVASELGIPWSEIAAENLRILASRRERGTLQGSGDDR